MATRFDFPELEIGDIFQAQDPDTGEMVTYQCFGIDDDG